MDATLSRRARHERIAISISKLPSKRSSVAALRAQPPAGSADTRGMPDPDSIDPHAIVLAALWYGALRIAAGLEHDPWPEDLAELADRYFASFRPEAKA